MDDRQNLFLYPCCACVRENYTLVSTPSHQAIITTVTIMTDDVMHNNRTDLECTILG
jgi:hypothetical protein